MFIHAGFAHIAFNLFALGYLGGYAERAIGVPRYVLVYFMSGIVAALFHGAIASYILHNENVVLKGASGAISGVFGIAAVAGNTRAYYWLVLQIVFAVIGSISALHSIYCSCRWIYSWCTYNQSINKIRAVKKNVKIFSTAMRNKSYKGLTLIDFSAFTASITDIALRDIHRGYTVLNIVN
jgi:membrane associated rhomboid family serine protease